MKYLFTSQNFHKSQLPLFQSSIFWKRISMLIKKHYGYMMFFIKFYYLIGPYILQLVFDFITYPIVV